jgi:NAD(P)-dependent dehydrogenase (short-subunit alcohol dehydrogenase family)
MNHTKNLFDIENKVVLITGAAGHLGSSIAEAFAELGAILILIDREETSLQLLVEGLQGRFNTSVEYIVCDFEQEEQRQSLILEFQRSSKGIDVLINNAAFVGTSNLQGWNTNFENQNIDTWRRALEVNVTAAFHLIQGLTSVMRKTSSPSIINVCSIYGVYAPEWQAYEGTEMNNPAAYSVSKAGLIQLTKWLASLLGPDIRVNAVSPGGISRNQPASFIEKYERKTNLGRMATEEDMVGPIIFLASNASKYITGQNIIVDGGWGN